MCRHSSIKRAMGMCMNARWALVLFRLPTCCSAITDYPRVSNLSLSGCHALYNHTEHHVQHLINTCTFTLVLSLIWHKLVATNFQNRGRRNELSTLRTTA